MKDHPHDEFFKYLFSITPVVQEFLEAFLPEDLRSCLDLDTLTYDDTEYITPDLASVFSDKVYRCNLMIPGGKKISIPAIIAILLEHKSFAPEYPHFQLNEYRQRIWSNLLSNDKEPVMVLPIILYHGAKPWKKRDMAGYFPNLPEAMRPYLGGFDYWLVDLAQFDDLYLLRLRLGFLAYGLLTMKHSHDRIFLEGQMKLIFERGEDFLKTGEGRIFVETLFVYYIRIAGLIGPIVKNKIMENIAESAQPAFLSTYDHIKLEGKIEGKIENALKVAEKLILKFPALPDDQIAEISGATAEDVKKIRERLSLQ